MRSKSFFVLTAVTLLSYSLFAWGSWAADYQNAILNVEDCVNAHWSEFESRTGDMPSRELEAEWRRECIAYLSSANS